MHLQVLESSGPAGPEESDRANDTSLKGFNQPSPSLPFGQDLPLSSIAGPTYLTAQTLIQQVAYTLSDKLFTYSPGTYDLDVAAKKWCSEDAPNAYGYSTKVLSMETRTGSASIALGYIFSNDFDLKKRYFPQTILASSSSLHSLRPALEQLSLLHSVASPFVAHIAAVDFAGGSSTGLVTDYTSALSLADELGFGLVSSFSAHESQHMSLFATLLSNIVPTIHVYDGLHVGVETTRVIDVLDRTELHNIYKSVLSEISGPVKRYTNVEGQLLRLWKVFNDELGTSYRLFDYQGCSSPDSVLVVFGTVEASLASQVASDLAREGNKVGVLTVRVYRPFVEEEFLSMLPKTVQKIAVLGQVQDYRAVTDSAVSSCLYTDVLAAITFSDSKSVAASVIDIKYPREQTWNPQSIAALFYDLARKPGLHAKEHPSNAQGYPQVKLLDLANVRQYSFWDVDESTSAKASLVVGQLLSKDSTSNVSVKIGHDNLVQGGVIKADIRDSKTTLEASYPVDNADVVYVGDTKLFCEYSILRTIKSGGTLLLKAGDVKDEELDQKLPVEVQRQLASREIKLFIVDPQASVAVKDNSGLETILTELAFLHVARNGVNATDLRELTALNGYTDVMESICKDVEKAVRQVDVPEGWGTQTSEEKSPLLPVNIDMNSFSAFEKIESEPPSLLRTWQTAAKGLAFKEAYGTTPALRPDLSVKTWTVHVKENRRLTPLDYERNVFHIEFDLGNSGLEYNIGEALGIHSENDDTQVRDFIEFYGLQSNEIVEIPSREDPMLLENRTVYQALMQNVDIFGRPPKRFYEALSEFASNEKECKELLTLGGPEGAKEFKRRAEIDTITYADVLLEFPSAHPDFHDIVRIVNPMKRREYSIASSQVVTPNSVALMIVVVGWVDPKGRDRFGQATRYLNALRVGAPVTVSVKPSVMKLPPKPTQPLIMAGLGTGLAPFRAFVQYRAWQKAQGLDIGSVLLYMGSRHQREEYLYGEEWEAYQDAGVITLLGRAFSRDQPEKIYIQDRMRQTLGDIVQAYIEEEGAFYLCGPTWPVPDVTEVLQEAIAADARTLGRKVDPRKEIEKLKDESRYVLEVY
ncbi:MAG: hypothetical protein M1827_007660 [Pycnora praestabilis]|nr:MAG: hypothetical protein M1827_007660 [Pycnora praestabilis]